MPEAAFAGALGVTLGGPNIYHGVLVAKPTIGDGLGPVQSLHITRACHLMVLSGIVWTAILWASRMIVSIA
jgi:adenosylcobinamide-phosphate synthase